MGTSLDLVGYILYDDEVFEQILMAEKPLALVSYLVGESCLLSSISCFFKGPGPTGVLPLHADTLGPQPFPTYAQTANINYALTPYTREGAPPSPCRNVTGAKYPGKSWSVTSTTRGSAACRVSITPTVGPAKDPTPRRSRMSRRAGTTGRAGTLNVLPKAPLFRVQRGVGDVRLPVQHQRPALVRAVGRPLR